ncbi:hypothetical protein BC351_00905 [Paenibacillus ferrarius]|uniref:Lipoprotein n=1 Tax=Paenibacillus ferrarius TaxID=1469647 RepID=A0A1V4HSC1_9BACL|nr:hypothetical protein [Paenibacillus ferrarius]OPH61831.1 hypothetical protein BC351_00905 [Paenibacillus ferrarius]
MKNLKIIVVVSSIAFCLTACSSKEVTSTTTTQVSAAPTVSNKPSEQPKAIASSAPQPTPSPTPQKVDNSGKENEFKVALKKYVDENFGIEGYKTSWYDSIMDYKVNIGDSETAVTVIVKSSTDPKKASNFNSLVLGFVNDQTQKQYKAQRVIVITENNSTLSDKPNPIKS